MAALSGPVPKPNGTQRKFFQDARAKFREMSLRELGDYEKLFCRFDTDQSGYLSDTELKYALEKMGAPQSHLALRALIKEIDLDLDGKISYEEFLMIFKLAKEGKLVSEGLKKIAACVNVDEAGVGGAAAFFEKKAAAINNTSAADDAAFFAERKAKAAEAAKSKAAFKAKMASFGK
eukprot:TRINITY_DN2312_c0_g1_i1.p2 TRINITY_DN2312_c0_g1~~TRINITY_DN2312_c0_g1_i1.p2  ORF type:complete len:177 (-),score=52.56 TRINITY_DN2312_c0_g1_i1:548-1078(-)